MLSTSKHVETSAITFSTFALMSANAAIAISTSCRSLASMFASAAFALSISGPTTPATVDFTLSIALTIVSLYDEIAPVIFVTAPWILPITPSAPDAAVFCTDCCALSTTFLTFSTACLTSDLAFSTAVLASDSAVFASAATLPCTFSTPAATF